MSCKIRSFSSEFYPDLLDLWEQLGLGGAERGDNLEVIKNTLQNGGELFVLFLDDLMIGSAWITNDSRRLCLHHFGIRKEFQNQGFGFFLTKHCINWCKTKKLQLKLEVNRENKSAINLYKKAGFKYLGDYDIYIIRN